MPQLTGPITAGRRGHPFGAAADADLATYGYLEEEFFIAGEATRFRHAAGTHRSADGHWRAEPAARAPYRTRLMVRRPRDAARFNGTVVVLWLNVSLGYDYLAGEAPEMYRGGFAVVYATLQRVGLEGYADTPERGLKGWDPDRYGDLEIPDDDYSYDILTQVAQALRAGPAADGPDLLGGLKPRRLLLTGASQSSMRIATYLNAIQPQTRAFDGFYLQIYFGNPSPLEHSTLAVASVEQLRSRKVPIPPGKERLRDDQPAPVFVLNTETEAPNFFPVRQPDTDRFRFWEAAGVAHGRVSGHSDVLVSPWLRDLGIAEHPAANAGCNNTLCYEPVNSAALDHMQRWMADGVPPPVQPPMAVRPGEPPTVERDALGVAVGGVRLPQVAAPRARHAGTAADGGFYLYGSATPFSEATLKALYPQPGDYARALDAAIEAALASGTLLAADAERIRETASETSA